VPRGKPFPDPYLLGARRCDADIERCIVVEDAPSGVESGKAAGARVIAVCTSHTRERMLETKPDFIVKDLSYVSIERVPEGFEVTIIKA